MSYLFIDKIEIMRFELYFYPQSTVLSCYDVRKLYDKAMDSYSYLFKTLLGMQAKNWTTADLDIILELLKERRYPIFEEISYRSYK